MSHHPATSEEGHSNRVTSDTCLEELVRQTLGTAVNHLKSRGLNAQGYIAFGRIVDAVSHHAEAFEADIVMVGHRAKTRFTRWWHDFPLHAELAERLPGSTIVTVTLPSGIVQVECPGLARLRSRPTVIGLE